MEKIQYWIQDSLSRKSFGASIVIKNDNKKEAKPK